MLFDQAQTGKIVISGTLTVLAFILALALPSSCRWLKLLAMLCSFLGDLILMEYRPLVSHFKWMNFYSGAVFFMAAHVAYILAFFMAIHKGGKPLLNWGFFIGIVLGIATIGFLLYLWFHAPYRSNIMLIVALIYACIISLNCSFIFSYAVSSGGLAYIAALGALSFFISDGLIGLSSIGKLTIAHQSEIVWWFYPIGQLLIILL